MVTVDRDWIRRKLRASLHALSLPGPEALATVPDGTCKADELALDFGNFSHAALDNFGDEFTPEQRAALEQIDALFDEMSGQYDAALWTEAAVCEHPKWRQVRDLANSALTLLGWHADYGAG